MKSIFVVFSVVVTLIVSSSFHPPIEHTPPFLKDKKGEKWADSILGTLSLDEQIGQLFMVAAYSNRGIEHQKEIEALITEHHIGGLIFFQDQPKKQVHLTNRYQEITKIPLLIAMDAEWGLGMRLDSTMNFPRQLTLGAIKDNQLIYQMGREIARQCKEMGVHVNFAPVVDVNNNPNNPVINDRSFGEDMNNVAAKGIAYMKGLQDGYVLACAKHFPGHGDTDKDSHKTLPTITHSFNRLDSLELYPFKQMIKSGVGSMMAAHLFIPSIDSTPNKATSLSKNAIDTLLKQKLGFEGLVFTDALNMRGVSSFYGPGEVDLEALIAGNDVLLFPEDVPTAISRIREAIEDGIIREEVVLKSVKKILQTKYWAGLNNYKPIKTDSLQYELHTPYGELLNRKLYESAITLVNNEKNLVPIKQLDKLKIASIIIGDRKNEASKFQETISQYAPTKIFRVEKDMSPQTMSAIIKEAKKFNLVIIGIQDMSRYASRDYGLELETIGFVNELSKQINTIVVLFGSPYSLKFFEQQQHLIVAYEDNDITQSLAAQLIFGGIQANGRLPVSTSKFKFNTGLTGDLPQRLKYTIPEEVGIDYDDLLAIDTIVEEAIGAKATPGCQILIAKDNKVFFQKSYGFHTYENERPVRNTDIYDLASITKISATTISMMKLVDDKKLKIKKKISRYIPDLRRTDKKNILISDVLLHQAGLKAWIPFYQETLNEEGFCDEHYCYAPNDNYSIKVANELYIQNSYTDSIWKFIVDSDLRRQKRYVYSDLGFYFNKYIVEQLSEQPLDQYVNATFYAPLGLSTMTYNPINKFPLSRIVPTEADSMFRRQLIHGYVHDQGAAMMGGVAGHAGVFSNANDLAILMQMLLNRGDYGYQNYLSSGVISEFTSKQLTSNRRGLGFDKPEPDTSKPGPTSIYASPKAFGHSGFTGTCVWADPEYNLVYVFLSNRVHPSADNRTLISTNVRTRIQDVIYQSLAKHKANS